MWYRYKEEGRLDVTEAEKTIFNKNFKAHKDKESSAKKVDMWLSTNRPILLQCKLRAKEIRMAQQKRKKGSSASIDSEDEFEGHSSADSFGDGDSVESMLVDPEDGVFDILGE